MSAPTVAELRAALHCEWGIVTPEECAAIPPACEPCAMKLRLRGVVVTDRDVLSQALARTRWWEHGGSGGGPDEWASGELADAVIAALGRTNVNQITDAIARTLDRLDDKTDGHRPRGKYPRLGTEGDRRLLAAQIVADPIFRAGLAQALDGQGIAEATAIVARMVE